MIGFLNLYLDCLLISKDSLTVFLRDWILEYKTEIIDRWKISVISHHQNSLWDKIFGKWDLLIQMWNDIDFSFHDVAHPKKSASKLILNKKQFEEIKKKENRTRLTMRSKTIWYTRWCTMRSHKRLYGYKK